MTSRHIQTLLASVFLGLGGWCVASPAMVEGLVFKPTYQHLSQTSGLLIACFGAQAALVGIAVLVSQFRAPAFLIFGLSASIPFFVFNWYFYFVERIFTHWMLLDFAGNLAILACGVIGFILERAERRQSARGSALT